MEQITAGKRLLDLFLTFLKLGCFTFGGGWSIVAQIEKEYVEKRGWVTSEELLDFTSVGRSMPGLMIGNISVLFGYRIAGIAGAVTAVVSLVTAPFLVMIAVVSIYTAIRDNVYVNNIMIGVRAAVVPIILCSLIKLFRPAMKDRPCYVIAAAAFLLSLFSGVSNVLIVFAGAVAGILITEVRSRNDLH